MIPTPRSGLRWNVRPASTALLVLAGGFLGWLANLPDGLGVVLVVAGIGAGVGLRAARRVALRSFAPVPAVVALAFGAVASPLGLVPELAAGGAGLALLVWLADDPARPVGGIARAHGTILVSALALGIAWSSALLLPSGSASLGVAAGLLVLAAAALAYLVARPELFDREQAATS
jgi:hypothetical protein